MVIANYVDDFAAVMTDESRDEEWAKLRKIWKFDDAHIANRFLGIEIYYPDEKNKRHIILHQTEYVRKVVARYEEDVGKVLSSTRLHLPNEEPEWPSEDERRDSPTHVKSAVGGIAYAARGTRPDLMKASAVEIP